MDHHIPHVGDPVRVRLPDPETSRRWYPKAFAANGRPGRVMAIRPQDCTRKYIVRFEDGSELELSADALENDYREERTTMDPTINLLRILETLEDLHNCREDGDIDSGYRRESIILLRGLASWLESDGFPPNVEEAVLRHVKTYG